MDAKEAYQIGCKALSSISDSASFEVFELLCFCADLSKTDVLCNIKQLSDQQKKVFLACLDRRANGEPLQYIVGEWSFFGREYKVGPGVLIPRADTEVLVETAISCARQSGVNNAADLCAGSGCIGISLSCELDIPVDCYEKSEDAFSYLQENIKKNSADCKAVLWDVCAESTGMYDMIVSNPPYLTKADMEDLQREVSFEPAMALYGEAEDGLSFYRTITKRWKSSLKPGGWLLYEIGMGQHDDVAAILEQNGFIEICTKKDLCGIIRVVFARRAEEDINA